MAEFVLPMCAKCGTFVERVLQTADVLDKTQTFTAYCHGAHESVTLTNVELEKLTFVTFSRAFEKELTGYADGQEKASGEGRLREPLSGLHQRG
jgi:hypothetical protein